MTDTTPAQTFDGRAVINGERVAALLLLYGNQTVEYFTPCVVEQHRSSQALPLLRRLRLILEYLQ